VNGRRQIPAKLVPLNDMAAGRPHPARTTIVPRG
jgi:hypothetical protein